MLGSSQLLVDDEQVAQFLDNIRDIGCELTQTFKSHGGVTWHCVHCSRQLSDVIVVIQASADNVGRNIVTVSLDVRRLLMFWRLKGDLDLRCRIMSLLRAGELNAKRYQNPKHNLTK
jgi:hypothetical protein